MRCIQKFTNYHDVTPNKINFIATSESCILQMYLKWSSVAKSKSVFRVFALL